MVVYCYELVPLRTKTSWTRAMDNFLVANYCPGTDTAMVTDELRTKFKDKFLRRGGFILTNRLVNNRLSELGLRNRMRKNDL